jgi:hypothetical protein
MNYTPRTAEDPQRVPVQEDELIEEIEAEYDAISDSAHPDVETF